MKDLFKDKKKIAIIILIVVAVALIGVGLVFLSKSSGQNKLNNELAIAHQFMESGDYDSAMAAFDRALEIDPTCVDAYLGKAEVTVSLGDYSAAISTLQAGYELTQSQLLDDKIDEYEKALEEEKRLEEERAKQEAEELKRLEKEAMKEAIKLEAQAKKQAKEDLDAAIEQIEICGLDLKTASRTPYDEWKKLAKMLAGDDSYSEDSYYMDDDCNMLPDHTAGTVYISDEVGPSERFLLAISADSNDAGSVTFICDDNKTADRVNDYVKLPDYFSTLTADMTIDEFIKWADEKYIEYCKVYNTGDDYNFRITGYNYDFNIRRWYDSEGTAIISFDIKF